MGLCIPNKIHQNTEIILLQLINKLLSNKQITLQTNMLKILSVSTTYQNVMCVFGQTNAWRSGTSNVLKGLMYLY